MKRFCVAILFGLMASVAIPASAHGQFVNPYIARPGMGFGGWGSVYPNGPGFNAGAALAGSADVTRAYGDVVVSQESARILAEQAKQAKIETKKKAFDQMLYEKANTPTYFETLSKENANILARRMNFPAQVEITDGTTLNTMLPLLQSLATEGAMGPPIPISQAVVDQLNISTSIKGSVGLLRDGGRVDWPLGLQGKNQEKLDKLLPQAYQGAATGKLTPKLMKEVRSEMSAMRETLRVQVSKDEIDTGTYFTAIQFYNSLSASIDALGRPDARRQLSGALSPKARNVQELVEFVSGNGLKFAPATPGNEAAYQVAHDAFVRYARTASGSQGFQALSSPIVPSGAKK